MPDTPRVGFFSPIWGRKGPFQIGWSDYWRLWLPALELRRNGWDVVFGRAVGAAEGGRLAVQESNGSWWGDRDVLVFHRWMSPHAPALLRAARGAGQVLVNDVDDLLWEMTPDHPGHVSFNQRGFSLDYWYETLGESSLLTTSTPFLKERLRERFDVLVELVRNYVDLEAWMARPNGSHVGWVGSPAGRRDDLAILREAVVPWLRERGRPFYHGGVILDEPRMRDVLEYENVVTRPFQPVTSYPRLWEPLRVALCPLADHPFSQAKSWVKALEACAHGIPFIATDHPEYRSLGVGRLARSSEDWVRHLEALEDPIVYAADCKINENRARQLAIARNWDTWAQILREAVLTEERHAVHR